MGYIETQITNAVSNGQVIDLGQKLVDAIIADPNNQGKDIISLDVPVGITINALSKVVGVLGGRSVSALVPKESLNLKGVTITLKSVGFIISKNSGEVIQLNAIIEFSGATLPLPCPGSKTISLSLNSIEFVLSSPGKETEIFMATVCGDISIGSGENELTIDASMTFPGEVITFYQPPGQKLDMGTFFTGLGLPEIGIIDEVSLVNMNFSIVPRNKSFDLTGTLVPTSGTSIELINGILSFTDLSFGFLYVTNGKPAGYLNGSFLFMNVLALDVRAQMSPTAWNFSGNIDIQGTCINLNIPPSQGEYSLPIGALITKLFPAAGANIPSAIADIVIDYLLINYSYSKDGTSNSNYEFIGSLKDQWTIGGTDIQAYVDFTITNDEKKISADFNIDGFDFTLGCDLTQNTKAITASISGEINGQLLAASGAYTENPSATPPNKTASLTVTSLPSLGALMAWFIKKLTGNPYFTLPEPWYGLLNDINFNSVLSGLTFEIEITPPP